MAVTHRPKDRLVLSLRWTGRAIGLLVGVFWLMLALGEKGLPPEAWPVVLLGVISLIGVGLSFWHDWIGGLVLLILALGHMVQEVLGMVPVNVILFNDLPLVIAGLLLLAASRYRNNKREPRGD